MTFFSNTNLLIEIFCEEIPGRMQKDAEMKAKDLMASLLTEKGLSFDSITAYVATRRIGIVASKVPLQTEQLSEERRGPRLNAPEAALQGFLKSVHQPKEALRQSGDYYYADIVKEAKALEDIIPSLIEDFLEKFAWPKVMRWHNPHTNTLTRPWIRPIRHISVLMNDKPVICKVQHLPLETGNQSRGHRFTHNDPLITLTSAHHYEEQLNAEKVIVPFEKRRSAVWKSLSDEASIFNLTVKADEGLLDEVTGLVDFPYASIGIIPDHFMTLPQEVLSTSMRVHQKYFTLLRSDGKMANRFGVITNVPKTDLMMQGLERVLIARLSDAHFFFNTDMKIPLENLRAKCDTIIFHEKTGTIGDKVSRLESIAERTASLLNLTSNQTNSLKRAIILCKSDLFTQMVGEFPELQGIMGRIYAKEQGEHPDVADALEQHYQPLGPSKDVPQNAVSRALALMDKIDTLVGFLGNDIKPTGNKDPLAIRRTALGIIRLLVESLGQNISNPCEGVLLPALIHEAIHAYHTQGHQINADQTKADVLSFIQTRFDVYCAK